MRGVCYIVWGNELDEQLERSIASLRTHHPDLPVHVERLTNITRAVEGLLQKACMFRLTPFDSTLFLDADTVVLGTLDFGFEKAERHGLACCICESPWARRHTGLRDCGDLVEYNTGVLFFSAAARPVFDAWEQIAPVLDSSTLFVDVDGKVDRQAHDDQASFALAVEQTQFVPYVLPLNWNYRPQFYRSFFGPLKIWHHYSPAPAAAAQLADYYRDPASIIQYHTSWEVPHG